MAEHRTRYAFFMGKGGVGKSTTAALSALNLAREGKKVLLVSLDPAHNQSDIFDTGFSGKPKKISDGLMIAESDSDKWIKHYLKDTEEHIKSVYSYHAAFDFGKHFKVLKHSPGIEEYALLQAFNHYRGKHSDMDMLVLDMPPTALSTKFFRLPSLSLVWLEHLEKLRREIIEKKEICTTIQFGKKTLQRDKILNKLTEQIAFYEKMAALFKDGAACRVHLVFNPEPISRSEARRFREHLVELGVHPAAYVCNKWDGTYDLEEVSRDFSADVHPVPVSQKSLIGLDALTQFLKSNPEICRFLGRDCAA